MRLRPSPVAGILPSRARERRLAAVLLALFALVPWSRLEATVPMPGRLQSNVLVAGRRVVFCQPDRTFTVLDLDSGRVLVRDTAAGCEGTLAETRFGVALYGWPGARIRMIDVERTVVQGRMVPGWTVDHCDVRLMLGDSFVCARPDGSVELRSMSDGRARWTHQPGGVVHDVFESGGRLLLQAGVYRLIHDIIVLDLSSGTELLRRSMIKEGEFSVGGFDGPRIVLHQGDGSCASGVRKRTLNVDWATRAITSQDECKAPEPPRWPPEGDCSRRACELAIFRRDLPAEPVLRRGTVSVTFRHRGNVLDGQSGTAKWRVVTEAGHGAVQYDVRRFLRRFTERDGSLFLESEGFVVGTLERLDLTTGQPRWIYVYPSEETLASTNSWDFRNALAGLRAAKQRAMKAWADVRARPPQGAVFIPPSHPLFSLSANSVNRSNLRDEVSSGRLSANPRVVFDPVPDRPSGGRD